MKFSTFTDVIGTIVIVALVTTIVAHGTGSASVLTAAGSAFSGSLRAAQGN